MGLIFRRTKGIVGTVVSVSQGSVSASRRAGRRLRISSRGGGSLRLFRGLSWRFGRRR